MSQGDTKERVKSVTPPPGERPTEKVGLVIDGRYRITGLVGRGGMGSVYRAEHVVTRRIVALKLLHATLAGVKEVSERFRREAFAIGRIQHENCVDVMDFGELEDGSLYLAMEFLSGRSLGSVMDAEKRLHWRRALHIARHVLRGLGHAHEHDIVHRDVKPENVVLVEQDGDPEFAKILDFGIAKLVGRAQTEDGGLKLTQAGVAFGTPIYMSPEQAVGNPVDPRADLYGVAVLLYEMIAGAPPFESTDKLEVLSMHATRPVPPMHEVAPDLGPIPHQVEDLVLKMLSKRPEKRCPDAASFVAEIDALLAMPDPSAVPVAGPRAATQASGAAHARHGTNHDTSAVAAASAPGLRGGTVPVTYATGPLGTGMARITTSRSRRNKIIAIAVGMITLIVIALVAGSGGNDEDADDAKLTVTERAAKKLSRGDAKGVIKLLKKHSKALVEDAQAKLILGHAHAAQRDGKEALASYTAALKLDEKLKTDEKLRINVQLIADGKDEALAVDGTLFLAAQIDDNDAKKRLAALPSDERFDIDPRTRALGYAKALGLVAKVDLLGTYKLDLIQGRSCQTRLEAVTKLRLLGNKGAIKALERAKTRRGRKGGKWAGQPVNKCLVEAATDAITVLQAL